ncbi:MAG: YkgJ family cysteine cluster protein [Candidatus ainarchaeum sp.]|jgi:Fe-S-cluster containining protein|nr:YkgJ family cysteine cluster protein [Candidatus ainarchaeum sp.]MDD4468220.1 YkgJ family cysteine cluster protein [Candidatus ainarchaeum sp.]
MKINENSPKHSKKEESNFCLECGECCKRYYITLLPKEVDIISKFLKISKKKFLENYCELNVKIYPKSTLGVLTYPSTFFPNKIIELIKKKSFEIPTSFFVVPQVVLKRENKLTQTFFNNEPKKDFRKACIFLEKNNFCKIYPKRPIPCKLFPFIAMPDLREQYPFCELFKNSQKDFSIESKKYYSRIQKYFKEVNKKSFKSIWFNPPKSGELFYSDTLLGKISIEELIEMMPKK